MFYNIVCPACIVVVIPVIVWVHTGVCVFSVNCTWMFLQVIKQINVFSIIFIVDSILVECRGRVGSYGIEIEVWDKMYENRGIF